MRTDQDSRHLGLFGPTRRKFDKSLPEAAAGRPLEPKLMQRSMGIMMSGLFAFALLAAAVLSAPSTSQAGEISIGISVRIGPPPIPVYAQPVCPGPGFMWTPGYWAYDPADGILLGSRHMGDGARSAHVVDTRLLGLGWRRISLACGLLGSPCGLLWGHQLWIRLQRQGF